MRKHFLPCALTVLLLGACSAVSKQAMPDGRNRVPVNSQTEIEQYSARAAQDGMNSSAPLLSARQLDAMRQEIASMKLQLATLAATRDIVSKGSAPRAKTEAGARTAAPPSPVSASRESTPILAAGDRRETIEVRKQSIIFRLSHPVAGTRFTPTASMQVQLLKAAQQARLVDIRGRTDANVADKTSGSIALERANAARNFLIAHGIAPAKIRASALAAGGFLDNNANDAGKARNRRVEIEAMDFDTAAYQWTRAATKGVSQ